MAYILGDIVRKEGAKKTLRYERNAICGSCNGIGAIKLIPVYPEDPEQKPCDTCNQTGKVIIETMVNIFPYEN